ncbi:MAG: flagellar basal body L-ring protein FlgH [Phycisphaeraceae bacterium]|nr:flagellar basal body L-ring protein FlgH [Phycisphaeraceae bacterium]
MKRTGILQWVAVLGIAAGAAMGYSAREDWSISLGDDAPRPRVHVPDRSAPAAARSSGQDHTLVPSLRHATFATVRLPPPREFSVHDLVTIVVNESASSQSSARIDTSKEAQLDAAIEAFIDLGQLIELRLQPTALSGGKPEIKTKLGNSFSGSGNYTRRDSLSTQIQAEIIDVKPNGNLVIEARKYIRSDHETLSIVLTGICRAADISATNTIRSSQIHDLRVVKDHKGELKSATEKGLITRVLEGLFAF